MSGTFRNWQGFPAILAFVTLLLFPVAVSEGRPVYLASSSPISPVTATIAATMTPILRRSWRTMRSRI